MRGFVGTRSHARAIIALVVTILVAGTLVPFSTSAQKSPPVTLTVSAAISLKDALDEIAKIYETRHSNVTVSYNYGGSGALQHQIEQGAPVDIFFSAAEKQMDALQDEHLILLPTRHDIVRNSLVLITPADSNVVEFFPDLAKPAVKTITLGEATTVPAGQYAEQTLQHLGLFEAIKNKVVYAKDVRQVLTYVETGNADAGLVYLTDALTSKKVRIAATAPEDSHDIIVYPLAVLNTTKNEAAARDFAGFIGGPEARPIFNKYGFSTPPIRD